jgi:hypothetical protein
MTGVPPFERPCSQVIVILVVFVSYEMLVILYGAFGRTHIKAPLP